MCRVIRLDEAILLQIVDAAAHVVDAIDDPVRHGLEASLHLLQQVLDEQREILVLLVNRVFQRRHLPMKSDLPEILV